MRFSIIMPAYLQSYEVEGIKSASDPKQKFTRAVDSYLNQTFKDSELIIVSDGCHVADLMWRKNYAHEKSIKFIMIKKQSAFSGQVRQIGIEKARGDIICYLDHDDFIGADHLKIINENFDFKYDWVFYNDYLIKGKEAEKLVFMERKVSPQLFYIGTSMIAHKRSINVVWPDNYAHDWRMIEVCLLPHQGLKITTPQYYVCHFHTKDF